MQIFNYTNTHTHTYTHTFVEYAFIHSAAGTLLDLLQHWKLLLGCQTDGAATVSGPSCAANTMDVVSVARW